MPFRAAVRRSGRVCLPAPPVRGDGLTGKPPPMRFSFNPDDDESYQQYQPMGRARQRRRRRFGDQQPARADVSPLRRAVPGTDRAVLTAAKRYRPPERRRFHRDAGYLEGRKLRRSRGLRAIERRSAFGCNLVAEQWVIAEFAALSRLWSLGAPVQRFGTGRRTRAAGRAPGHCRVRIHLTLARDRHRPAPRPPSRCSQARLLTPPSSRCASGRR